MGASASGFAFVVLLYSGRGKKERGTNSVVCVCVRVCVGVCVLCV